MLDPENDPIAQDPIVQEFHNKLKKWSAVHTHDRGDPKYNDADNWIEVVPDMHIPM